MPARTPHGRRLDAILADGHWHDLHQVIDDVAAAVPPGTAHRHTLTERARKNTGVAPHQSRARHDTIAVGARDLARKLIDSRIRRHRVERDRNRIRRVECQERAAQGMCVANHVVFTQEPSGPVAMD